MEAVFSKYQVIVSSCKEAQKLPSLSPAEGVSRGGEAAGFTSPAHKADEQPSTSRGSYRSRMGAGAERQLRLSLNQSALQQHGELSLRANIIYY